METPDKFKEAAVKDAFWTTITFKVAAAEQRGIVMNAIKGDTGQAFGEIVIPNVQGEIVAMACSDEMTTLNSIRELLDGDDQDPMNLVEGVRHILDAKDPQQALIDWNAL